ncbi:MAG: hypothetical protein WDL87_07725 [Candidatus Omnitrophota bacterium]|jgi:hypothetical protein
MVKKNCWEVKKCGREPGGAKVKELGVCPAAIEGSVNGVNCGKNAGRCCWAVAGTFCDDKVSGSFASKITSCVNCDFFKTVVLEEGQDLKTTKDILEKLYSQKKSNKKD